MPVKVSHPSCPTSISLYLTFYPFYLLSFIYERPKIYFLKYFSTFPCIHKKYDFNGILLFYKQEFSLIFQCLLYSSNMYIVCYTCVSKTILTIEKEIFIVFCCRKKIGYKYQSEFLLTFFSTREKKIFFLHRSSLQIELSWRDCYWLRSLYFYNEMISNLAVTLDMIEKDQKRNPHMYRLCDNSKIDFIKGIFNRNSYHWL